MAWWRTRSGSPPSSSAQRTGAVEPVEGVAGGIGVFGGDVAVLEPGPHDGVKPRPISWTNHPAAGDGRRARPSYLLSDCGAADPPPASDRRGLMATVTHAPGSSLSQPRAAARLAGCSSSDTTMRQSRPRQSSWSSDARPPGWRPRLTVGRGGVALRDRRPGGVRHLRRWPVHRGAEPDSSATRATGVARRSPTTPSPTGGWSSRPTAPTASDEYDDAVADLDPFENERPMSTTDGAAPVTGETGDSGEGRLGSIATMAWPALGMLMVASVGSIAQLSDSASFGLGRGHRLPPPRPALPAAGRPGVGGAGHRQPRRHLRVGQGRLRRSHRVPGHVVRVHEQRDAVPVAPALRCRRAGHGHRAPRPGRPTAPTWARSCWWCSGWPH